MRFIKQSSTAHLLTFLLVSSTDHITPITGIVPTVTISKAGAAFAAPSGAITEIGNGWYKVAGNATDSNTLGSLILHATGTGADPTDREYEVVLVDTQAASFGLALAKGTNLTGLNDIATGSAMTLTAAYDAAKTAGTSTLTDAQVWAYATRVLTAGTNIVLAKGTGLTGLNDIAAGAAMTLTAAYDAAKTAGTSTLTDVQVWAYAARALTDKAGFSLSIAPPTAAAIADAVDAKLSTTHPGDWAAVGNGGGGDGGFTEDDRTQLNAAATYTARLNSALEPDGLNYRFTGQALINSPSGSGAFTDVDRAKLDDIAAQIVAGVVNVQSPVSEAGDSIRIVRGDNYSAVEGRSLEFTGEAWPILDGAVLFKFGCSSSIAATITGDRTVRVELVPSDTATLQPQTYRWELEATQANGHVITLTYGDIVVLKDL